MTKTSVPLKVALTLLMIISAIELSFISSTVAYLHKNANRTYPANYQGNVLQVPSLPSNLSVNQGHTSNGTAGTGLIVIGWCGTLALFLRGRPIYHKKSTGGLFARVWYRLWLFLNVPALLLTLGALAYVFAVTNKHQGQTIDLLVVKQLTSADSTYPLLEWTPQNWFDALLKLDLVSGSDRSGLETIYKVSRGWQYNLIPFFLVQLAETLLAFAGEQKRRKQERHSPVPGSEKNEPYAQPGQNDSYEQSGQLDPYAQQQPGLFNKPGQNHGHYQTA